MIGVLPPTVGGTILYEARMAVRRRVLWITQLPLTALSVLLTLISPVVTGLNDPVARIGASAVVVSTFCTVGTGVALADRLTQHHRPGLTELLDATPNGGIRRMAGVLLGPLAVALAPIALSILALGAVSSIRCGTIMPVGASLIGVFAVVLPGALALAALATLLGLVLPLAMARVLVVAVWFWATVASPRLLPIPTVTGTVFSPLGGYAAAAWLHSPGVWATREGTGPLTPTVNNITAAVNVALVLMLGAVFFAMARAISARRR